MYWLVAILLPIFAVYQALAVPIEEYGYDTAEFHIYRAVVYSDAHADGWLYPRWAQPINAGLGGPFFSLYPPLAYSLMDAFHLTGISIPMSWRVLVALGLVAGSAGMFGLALALVKRADIALAGAAVFIYSGYLLRDLFERGAPSGIALALFPMMLWLLIRFVERPSGLRLLLAALCLAAIILIHSQTAFLLAPLAGLVILFLWLRGGIKDAAQALVPLFGGVLLAAFYMLPFPIQVKNVQFDNALQIDYANPVLNPFRLQDILALPQNLDIGLGNNRMGESPDGLLHALALVLGIAVVAMLVRKKQTAAALLIAGLVLFGFAVLWMQLDAATPVWSALPGLSVFLFRWKLLGILGISSAIIVCYALKQLPERFTGIAAGALIVVYVTMHLNLLYPQLFYHYAEFAPSPTIADVHKSAIQHRAFGLSSFDEFLPITRAAPLNAAELQKVTASPIENIPAGARLVEQRQRTGLLELTIESPVPFVAALHTLYYPGWVGYVDDQAQALTPQDTTGYTLINVPAGTRRIVLKYEGTLVQHIGEAITVVTFVVLLGLAVVWRGPKRTMQSSASIGGNPMNRVARQSDLNAYGWSILPLILLAVAVKAAWVDPQTTLFRDHSTCAAVRGAQVQTDVRFGDQVRLCAYSLESANLKPGDWVSMTLYWQLEQPARESADAFVHLLGSAFNPETNNPLWGQQDKQNPGEHELAHWTTGKLFRDRYDFRVPLDTPPGEYQLEIGWRRPADDQRLKPRIARAANGLSVSSLDALLVSSVTVR
ncbi:MAG: hypothetical protein HY782_07540 [Chloroflexi bacterium]|nr:hypothetical protein [Chloroflexota bacterium]